MRTSYKCTQYASTVSSLTRRKVDRRATFSLFSPKKLSTPNSWCTIAVKTKKKNRLQPGSMTITRKKDMRLSIQVPVGHRTRLKAAIALYRYIWYTFHRGTTSGSTWRSRHCLTAYPVPGVVKLRLFFFYNESASIQVHNESKRDLFECERRNSVATFENPAHHFRSDLTFQPLRQRITRQKKIAEKDLPKSVRNASKKEFFLGTLSLFEIVTIRIKREQ